MCAISYLSYADYQRWLARLGRNGWGTPLKGRCQHHAIRTFSGDIGELLVAMDSCESNHFSHTAGLYARRKNASRSRHPNGAVVAGEGAVPELLPQSVA